MSEMLKRVADAIFDAGDMEPTQAERCAIAALKAMREPNDAMLEASWATVRAASSEEQIATRLATPYDAHRYKTKIRHRAMIDAALA